MAANSGNFEICQFIIDNVAEKNPKNDTGLTPLHLAASKGHFEICDLILKNTNDKNPEDWSYGLTPLHAAAQSEHIQVFQLIFDSVEIKNPKLKKGYSLLHDAAYRGYTEICIFMIDRLEEKNLSYHH